MPFEVIRQENGRYRLWNLHKKEYAKKSFLTKASALSAGMNYMRYRREQGYIFGNKILVKKKKPKT